VLAYNVPRSMTFAQYSQASDDERVWMPIFYTIDFHNFWDLKLFLRCSACNVKCSAASYRLDGGNIVLLMQCENRLHESHGKYIYNFINCSTSTIIAYGASIRMHFEFC
jgi:hypothetical protein